MQEITITVSDLIKENEQEEVYIYLSDFKSYDDVTTEIIWAGNLKEVPEEYHKKVVRKTAQSLRDLQQGINSYYVYV